MRQKDRARQICEAVMDDPLNPDHVEALKKLLIEAQFLPPKGTSDGSIDIQGYYALSGLRASLTSLRDRLSEATRLMNL